MSTKDLLAGVTWRKSSLSGGGGAGGGNCVEAAHLPNGQVAIRDSKNPHSGAVFLTQANLTACLDHIKSGQLH